MHERDVKKRKVRSDKKKAIAPFILDNERVWIHRIARRCELPEGETGLQLIKIALNNEACILFFSSYFKRNYQFTSNQLFFGHHDSRSIYDYIPKDKKVCERFKMKFNQPLYDQVCEFQIALGIPYLAHATYAILRYALHDIEIVRVLAPGITKQDFNSPMKILIKPDKQSKAWSILK
jgi:hypothetical protein